MKTGLWVCSIFFTCIAISESRIIGYDANLGHIFTTFPVNNGNIKLGAGIDLDTDPKAVFAFSISAFYVKPVQQFGNFGVHYAIGVIPGNDLSNNFNLSLFVGLQPALTISSHLALSSRFGINLPIAPEFQIQTKGSGISGAAIELRF